MAAQPKPKSEINVLVVDDTPDNLRLLAKILESQGYIVRKSLNARMALQAAHRYPPDLILLDINMPDLNGYELCQQLKESEQTSQVPIIFISALDQINDKLQAFELGGQDYITKPFQELEVLARVKNQLLIQRQQKLLVQQNLQLQQEVCDRQRAETEITRLNADLERQVQARTLELQQSLSFELALKQISDHVRDSLDQHQILQTAVATLAKVLDVPRCDAALYSPNHNTSTIHYQWVQPGAKVTLGQMVQVADQPGLYEQLQQRICFAFCQVPPNSMPNHATILACPIFDDQVDQTGILGDLWLYKDTHSSFTDMEIHLVQQTATQCAIALRQARLYEAAQGQVKELERLNQLKDDFLSTISHELRTPIASMKMIIKLLDTVTDHGRNFCPELSTLATTKNNVVRYLEVLHEECDRELALVESLLSLQHIEAGTYSSHPVPINLQALLPHLIEPFETRTQNHQQILQVAIDPDLPILSLDPLAINRVITELLSNACKYTPAGGEICIQARLLKESSDSYSSGFFQFSISNTGIEIPIEEHHRIFDKFYRIPNNDPWRHGGTGLGLALVKKLVEQMNGMIHVESAAGKTCFLIQLPLILANSAF